MEREKKYTKGEWYIADYSIEANNKMIASSIPINMDYGEEERSNAQLISAAPDLLEALEALQDQYIEICNNVGLSHIIDENWAFQKAEKAIAKAYGEKE